jgi:hypothetical protein
MLLIERRNLTLVRIEPWPVPLKQSGVTTSPLDQVTVILMEYKYFQYFKTKITPVRVKLCTYSRDNRKFSNCLFQLLSVVGILAVKVWPIHSNLRFFFSYKKTHTCL